MDEEESPSRRAAGRLLHEAREQLLRQLHFDDICARKDTFGSAYKATMQARKTDWIDPMDENLSNVCARRHIIGPPTVHKSSRQRRKAWRNRINRKDKILFSPTSKSAVQRRKPNWRDPRDEELWPLYREAARAVERAEAISEEKRRLPRMVCDLIAPSLVKILDRARPPAIPLSATEPFFVTVQQLHPGYVPEQEEEPEIDLYALLQAESESGSESETEHYETVGAFDAISDISAQDADDEASETETPETVGTFDIPSDILAQDARDEDSAAIPDTVDYNEPVTEEEQPIQTDTPDVTHSAEDPITQDSRIIPNDVPTETEATSSVDPFGAEAYKAYLEANPQFLFFGRTPDQTKQLDSNVLHQPNAEIGSMKDPSFIDPKTALQLVEQTQAVLSHALSQPSFAPLVSTSQSLAIPSSPSVLDPRSPNTHLGSRLLEYPSATALTKMESTAATTRTGGTGRGDQEAWTSTERQLLHRAANQWWHWKDRNRLSKPASSGAALYRYFELVFAEAGLSRSYYQLKNQWSRNERARYGRSEQRNKTDGTARDLVTSARPAAKARVEAEAAKSAGKRSRKDMEATDDDDEDDDDYNDKDYQFGGKRRPSKLARSF